MKKRSIRILLVVICVCIAVVVLRNSITATREEDNKPKDSGSILALEMNSDIVKDVYSKLTLFDDKIGSVQYSNLYFDFEGSEKDFTIEEKMYILFENMFDSERGEITREDDDIYSFKIDQGALGEEAKELFKDEVFEPIAANFGTSLDCGIIGYLYTGQEYELKIKKCEDKKEETKTKLIEATKNGNFIELKMKAMKILPSKKGKNYEVRNFSSDKVLMKDSLKNIEAKSEEIFERSDIDEYTFSFELKGDDYYLFSIRR